MKRKISLSMIVKNEESVLERCLKSVHQMVDEIIVVDTGSTDATKEIAYRFGAKVFDFPWDNSFAEARNYAIEQCTGVWILVLDADEYFQEDQSVLLRSFIEENDKIGRIRIISSFYSNNETRFSHSDVSRLFPKNIRFSGRIHEQLDSSLVRMDTGLEISHDGYFKSNKGQRNLDLLLLELAEKPGDSYLFFQLGKEYKKLLNYSSAEHYFQKCYDFRQINAPIYDDLVVQYLYTMIETKNYSQGLNVINNEQSNLLHLIDFHFVSGLFYTEIALFNSDNPMSIFPLIEQSYLNCLVLNEQDGREIVIGTGSAFASYNLAVYYEMSGVLTKAKEFYRISSEYDYLPAVNRLQLLE
jgi:glycosyltransferase involved in cell wall biosynthesis